MRTALRSLILALLMELSALGQHAPKVSLFGGYSYLTREIVQDLHGWNASVEARITNQLGVVADFGGSYGHEGSEPFRIHSFLFGPQLFVGKQERFKPFVHALFGGIVTSRTATVFVTPPCPGTQNCFPVASGTTTIRDSQLALALGGGFDLRLRDSLAVRLIQADYFTNRRDQSFNRWEDNWRFSGGLVFYLGRK
jgi:hypothetical protein